MVMPFPGVSRAFAENKRLADLIQRGRLLVIPTNAGWTEVVTGSGTGSQGIGQLAVTTGATNSSTDLWHITAPNGLSKAGQVYTLINWDKPLIIICRILRLTSAATGILRFQLKEVNTIGALAAKGIGWRVDNFSIVGESYGTELGTVSTGITMVHNEDNEVVIFHDSAVPKIEFWVDGVLTGTQSTAANMPTGMSGTSGKLVFSVEKGAVATDVVGAVCYPIIFQLD